METARCQTGRNLYVDRLRGAGVLIGRAIACQWLRFYQHHPLHGAAPCADFHSGQRLPRSHAFLCDLRISDHDKNIERR
jgi:hypothetical protein